MFCSGIDKCECLRRVGQNAKDSCNFANVRIFLVKTLLLDKEANNEREAKIISLGL